MEERVSAFVTNQYYTNMQKILPQYGIDFHVIPRKMLGEQVISASRIRKCLRENQLETIKELVPEPTCFFAQMQRDME